MVIGVGKIAIGKAVAACLGAAMLAGCSSVVSGPLALTDARGPVSTQGSVPSILPEPNPRTITLRSRSSETFTLTVEEQAGSQRNFVEDVYDPLQPLNRAFHQINRGVDFVVMRPIAAVYNKVLPGPLRLVIKNGLRHIAMPANIANYALQGEGKQAVRSLERFVVNTVAGFGGLFDIASKREELDYRPTDFGITLGKWGMGEGAYYDIPLIGPNTTRSSIGRIVDIALSPMSYLVFASDFGSLSAVDAVAPGIRTLEIVEMRARNADLVDEILYASPDTYVTLRTVYLQNRRSKLAGREVTESNLPDILEFTARR